MAETESVKRKVELPSTEDLLASGVQFGHETQRWHPKMGKYIFDSKNNIHLINIEKTIEGLDKAANFLAEISEKGNVMFVGTKRQTSRIIKEAAINSGSFFVDQRWAGGILTNFNEVKKSLLKLNTLEKGFEQGVQDRTKYEVTLMKKEWQKLNRLYSGIKTMDNLPVALIIVDAKFERGAIREAKRLRIPVIGIVDTNTDPELIDYIIPGNDDAIHSIKILIDTLSEAVKLGNGGKGIKHNLTDYSKYEVQIKKTEQGEIEGEKFESESAKPDTNEVKKIRKISSSKSDAASNKGILERVQEKKEKKTK